MKARCLALILLLSALPAGPACARGHVGPLVMPHGVGSISLCQQIPQPAPSMAIGKIRQQKMLEAPREQLPPEACADNRSSLNDLYRRGGNRDPDQGKLPVGKWIDGLTKELTD